MSSIKVGCLCVSAGRAILLPVTLRSYESQTHGHKTLLIEYGVPRDQLTYALDEGCRVLFHRRACNYVAIWDDDDYSPPDRLARSVNALRDWHSSTMPAVTSYGSGWFCNVATLRCERVDVAADGHLWGGALVFNRVAWEALGSFRAAPVPGYDRELQTAAKLCGGLVTEIKGGALPVALCHGRNMATFMRTAGGTELAVAAPEMPAPVREAILSVQSYVKAKGLHVPGPEV